MPESIVPNDVQITKIISDWVKSTDRAKIVNSKKYYLGNVSIKNREFYYWGKNYTTKKLDNERSNLKINNDFYGIIIDQKIQYCMGLDVVIDVNPGSFDINDFIDEAGLEASKSGKAWLHFYINEAGELKYKVMESENIIPLYDGTIEDNLTGVIRIYSIGELEYAEYYNSEIKIIYEYKENMYIKIQEVSHFNGGSFNAIPFIYYDNNLDCQNDLEKIKTLIDAYDLVISDFANNFVDFQELILFITNYSENASTEEAAKELMEWLKKYKLISVRKEGSMEILAREVPYEARKEFLGILRKNIFYFGRGVDVDQLQGGSLTNIVIKAFFANLDMKSNQFIKQGKKFIKRVFEFLNSFNEFKNIKNNIDVTKLKITFNKSQIINEAEIIESCVKSEGVISRETIIENHPWVDDIGEELARVAEDDARNMENINNSNLEGEFNDEI